MTLKSVSLYHILATDDQDDMISKPRDVHAMFIKLRSSCLLPYFHYCGGSSFEFLHFVHALKSQGKPNFDILVIDNLMKRDGYIFICYLSVTFFSFTSFSFQAVRSVLLVSCRVSIYNNTKSSVYLQVLIISSYLNPSILHF